MSVDRVTAMAESLRAREAQRKEDLHEAREFRLGLLAVAASAIAAKSLFSRRGA